jgi:hypothetical protein
MKAVLIMYIPNFNNSTLLIQDDCHRNSLIFQLSGNELSYLLTIWVDIHNHVEKEELFPLSAENQAIY